jgi:4-aminobutyrate aminotransferase-like enzyme
MTTRQTLEFLRAYESRNITFVEPDGSWPIVWERARGVRVWDAEGRGYLDLTAAFGVSAAGHANPRVVRAGQNQMERLLHAMGDVHPHALKAELARELSRITFERWDMTANSSKGVGTGKTIFCNSGFEAVEAALKTAHLATGKPGIIAFEGGYHGLGYGALNATHRSHFRAPFLAQLREFGTFLPFPGAPSTSRSKRITEAMLAAALTKAFRRGAIGAVLIEPVQVRGGVRIPPPWFLPMLRRICNRQGALLILDEIYTGFGRTGRWFACEHANIAPDLICLGKALTGGFPLSACVGRAGLMDQAWPPSSGEAIHTSTFLGHPVGCAMALAQIEEIRSRRLIERSRLLGDRLLRLLQTLRPAGPGMTIHARGLGLLAGVELLLANSSPATEQSITIMKGLLQEGFIVLPEGEHSNVISFTPPLTISQQQLARAVKALDKQLRRVTRPPS